MPKFTFKLVLKDGFPRDKYFISIIKKLDRKNFPNDPLCSLANTSVGNWWLVYSNKKPVGYCCLEVDKINKRGFLSRSAANMAVRGYGVQRQMIRLRERFAIKLGLKSIWSYISTDNIISGNNLIKTGYKLFWPKRRVNLSNAVYFYKELISRHVDAPRKRSKH